jgi:hypothetical protein
MYQLHYDSNIRAVVLNFDGPLFFDEYKAAWMSAIELIERHRTHRFLIDATNHKTSLPENLIWFKEEFLRLANSKVLSNRRKGGRRIRAAKIKCPESSAYEDARVLEAFIRRENFAFDYQVFDNKQDALEWLFE